MTITTTEPRSAYPPAIADLMPQARAIATTLGALPSQNRLKRDLHIGPEKAVAILAALTDDGPEMPVSPAGPAPDMDWPPTRPTAETSGQGSRVAYPATTITPAPVAPASTVGRSPSRWPLVLIGFGAFVAIWSGWVGLGAMTGFGIMHPLPGIYDRLTINTAITLPIGVETYAAYAIRIALSPLVTARARRFAGWSVAGALVLGAAGQVAYHLMVAYHITHTPPLVTVVVSCLPVATLGMAAALAHLTGREN